MNLVAGESIGQHVQDRPVLDRPAGVRGLDFGEHADARELLSKDMNGNERSLSDQPQRGITSNEVFDFPSHVRAGAVPIQIRPSSRARANSMSESGCASSAS